MFVAYVNDLIADGRHEDDAITLAAQMCQISACSARLNKFPIAGWSPN